ncbi:Protein translocase subunit SecE [Candidatus Gullanella endobia]|uniref:Protein translocase subunit SecE n=1 Tax=Candidatus Gullanella endobia TaxID=1070130 RepID=A0A143WQD0_9ENTR|nr:preprotein translocase subunit SecE [Candidatus Gullanella endobia]CUX95757.1 Protein translocase subunit SecE [Candidatus Gullanella endobia]
MSTNIDSKKKGYILEILKWLVITILLLLVIVCNYYYSDYYLLVRVLFIVLIIAVMGSIIMITNKGKFVVAFAREARNEIRKVVWPTRKETLYTTLIVAAVTILMSLILWGLDSILVHVVSFIILLRF